MARAADPPPATISAALALLNTEFLLPLMELLAIARPRPTRKADMVRAIESHLAGDRLRKLWGRLDEKQQLAVREALHTPFGVFDRQQFEAKYGSLPAGLGTTHTRGRARPLHFFLYPRFRQATEVSIVPPELARRLAAFVTPPPEATVAAADELPEAVELPQSGPVRRGEKPSRERVPLTRRDTERTAPHELLAVLRLIDGGRVAVSPTTRRPATAASQRVAEVLSGGDFFEPTRNQPKQVQAIGPIRAFAWPCLVQAARLAELRGSRLALTKAGRAALTAPPPQTLRRLWERWLKSTQLDEFSRITDIKGQSRGKGRRTMTAPAGRRAVIAEALAQCPVGRWVRFDDFSRFMQAASFDFDVTRNPWNLYIAEPGYGDLGYDGSHDWHILQGRYLLCLLFEYAATLGLIDVAYIDPRGAREDYTHMWGADDLEFLSRYDGLQYFRLNSLGAYCLGLAAAYEPSAPPARAALTVFPGLWLQAGAPLSPEERLFLDTYADAEADGVWRLNRDKTLSAIESGHDADELRRFLAARDDQPLPETVEGFLRAAERGARALTLRGAALLLECADAETAARLATDASTAAVCRRAGERLLVVRTASEKAFRKAARALGYGVSPA